MPTPTESPRASRTPQTNSKLSRLIEKYELAETGDRVEEYWLKESDDRYSLRELAVYVNHQLLESVMHDAGMNPLDGEVENTYRLLTDDDVSTGTRTQVRRRLQRAGIDVEELEADFVSRQAVHTYLTSVRGVSYSADNGDPVEKEATNIRRLQRRMTTMTERKLERLRSSEQITLGEFNLLVDMRVLCEDCGTQYAVSELLDERTCECSTESA